MQRGKDKMRILQGYGLTLRQLEERDIEMVRQWRNDPQVSDYMAFRGHISRQQQTEWFKAVNNENNHFFIIELAGTPIGLCELKKIDWTERTAEGGIFIKDEQFRNSVHGVASVVLLCEYGFGELGLARIYAQILDENARAIRFNTMLGYQLLRSGEAGKSVYFLTAEAFQRACAKLKPGLDKIALMSHRQPEASGEQDRQ